MTEKFARHPGDINEPEQSQRQFDVAAASWDAKHGPTSSRAPEFAARIRYLRKICAALGRPSVVDLGCGTGQVLFELLPVIKCGIGVDISPAMIERAQRAAPDHRLQFRVGDAARFCSQWQGRFDVVLLIGTLDHLPDQAQALAAAGRLIRPRGRLVVISPHPWSPIFLLKRLVGWGRDMPPVHHFSPRHLVARAREQGLRLIRIRALPYAPWPVLSPLFARLSTTGLFGPKSSLTGAVRGAFAAEFRPGGSHHGVD